MQPLFHIIFADETRYIGGDIVEQKWNAIPRNKKIKTLSYLLPNGEYIVLHGYDKYAQMIEVVCDLNGDKKGQHIPVFSYVMAIKNHKVFQYKIDLKTGNIEFKKEAEELILPKLNPDIWRG
jgi:hypothetical protein